MPITDYQAKYLAYELTKRCASDDVEKLAAAVAGAQVDLNPHQVDAALLVPALEGGDPRGRSWLGKDHRGRSGHLAESSIKRLSAHSYSHSVGGSIRSPPKDKTTPHQT